MKTIKRVPLIDEVVREIREAIASGQYEVGDKLATETELSERLGVGRSTVREGLRVLQAQGYVEIRRGRGAFVQRTTEESEATIQNWFAGHEFQLLDFIEVRKALEPLAARLAVERATDEDLERMSEVLERFEAALKDEDVPSLAENDEAFHSAIAEAAHNTLLQALSGVLAEAFREYRLKSFAVTENAVHALDPHHQILAALEARDADRAVREMIRHIEISREDIQAVVAQADTSKAGGDTEVA